MQKNSPVFAFPGFSPKIFLANYRTIPYNNACIMCRCDGIGRRDGLKIRWWRHRVGSSPTTGTTSEQSPLCSDVLLFLRNKRTSSARSLAPPFRPRFASPDSRSVFDRGRNENIRNEATCQKEMPPVRVAFLFGVLSICCVYPPAGVSQCGGLPAKPARRRPGQPPSAASHG